MTFAIVPDHAIVISPPVRSRWTVRTTGSLCAVLLLGAIFLPTSSDGTLRPSADLAIAGVATSSNWLMVLYWRRHVRALDAVLVGVGVGALALATATSPFYGTFSFGSIPYLASLFGMLLVRPPNRLIATAIRSLDTAAAIASWVLVAWGAGVVLGSAAVQTMTIRYFPAFYQDLVRFMVIEVRHPVGPFGTHSVAGFWYFLLFLIAYRRWLVRHQPSALLLAVSLLAVLALLRSFTAVFLGALAIGVMMVPSAAFPRPTDAGDRTWRRRSTVAIWAAAILTLVRAFRTLNAYGESIFGVQFGGFSGRYSLSSGRIYDTLVYLRQHPLAFIGITKSSRVVFGDSGLIEFYLRGGPLLLVSIYGLWGRLLWHLSFRGRTWLLLFAGLLAFDVGFTALTLARLQLALIPLLLALRSAGIDPRTSTRHIAAP